MPKADFASWKQENLAKYADEVSEENAQLREDNKVLLRAWRAEVTQTGQAGVLGASQGHPSPAQSPRPAQATADGASL